MSKYSPGHLYYPTIDLVCRGKYSTAELSAVSRPLTSMADIPVISRLLGTLTPLVSACPVWSGVVERLVNNVRVQSADKHELRVRAKIFCRNISPGLQTR